MVSNVPPLESLELLIVSAMLQYVGSAMVKQSWEPSPAGTWHTQTHAEGVWCHGSKTSLEHGKSCSKAESKDFFWWAGHANTALGCLSQILNMPVKWQATKEHWGGGRVQKIVQQTTLRSHTLANRRQQETAGDWWDKGSGSSKGVRDNPMQLWGAGTNQYSTTWGGGDYLQAVRYGSVKMEQQC